MSRRTRRNIWRVLAIGWLSLLVGAALMAHWLPLPFSPDSVDLTQIGIPPFLPPSAPNAPRHWLGTDSLGRDVLTALVFGARTAVFISLPVAVLATLLGVFLGSIAGFWGNKGLRVPVAYWLLAFLSIVSVMLSGSSATTTWWTVGLSAVVILGVGAVFTQSSILQMTWPLPADRLVLGAIALLAAVPRLVLVLALAAVQDASLLGLFVLLTLTYWPESAQLIRAELLRARALPYIEAAKALGLSGGQILWRHALPNAWRTVRTAFPLSLSALIALETTLSFIGVGLPPEMPSWGRTLAAARLDPTAWWLIVFPAVALASTTLALRQLANRQITL